MKDNFNTVRLFALGIVLTACMAWARPQDSMPQQPAPDNTKMNKGDANSSQTTADQQKENQSDRQITQQIRKSLMNDKALSTYAHNIKIVAQNGTVTLKGPVRSEDEKQAIEQKAAEVVGKDKVTNDLSVKPKK
jgi:osmotically-inducible protein OsmY